MCCFDSGVDMDRDLVRRRVKIESEASKYGKTSSESSSRGSISNELKVDARRRDSISP